MTETIDTFDDDASVDDVALQNGTVDSRVLDSDLANSYRLAARYGSKIRWVTDERDWYVYDGAHWRPNGEFMVMGFANELPNLVIEDLTQPAVRMNDNLRDRMAVWVKRSASMGARTAAIKGMQGLTQLQAVYADFDRDPYLLNFQNGTFDLRAGVFREHRQSDMLSKVIPRNYDPRAGAPKWRAMVARGLQEAGPEAVEYLQKAMGAALVGKNMSQQMFFLHGKGQCGKSKVVEIARRVLGDGYATKSTVELIARHKYSERHSAVTWKIRGKRYVDISEAEERMELDVAFFKDLTGSDVFEMRKLREQSADVPTSWTVFVATNEVPTVAKMTEAERRRIVTIPFGPPIPDDEVVDGLPEQILEEESEGVLAWLIEGYKMFVECGSDLRTMPPTVRTATTEQHMKADSFWRFIDRECVIDEDKSVKKSELYDAYKKVTSANSRLSSKEFTARMLEKFELKGSGGNSKWVGLALENQRSTGWAGLQSIADENDDAA